MTRRVTTMVCILMGLLALAGCRDRETSKDKAQELCVEIGKLDGSVAQVAAVEPGPTAVATLKKLRADMEIQYKAVQAKAKDVHAFKIDALNKAYNDMLASFQGVNDEAALKANLDKIDKAAGDFSDARFAVFTTAGC